MVVVTDTLGWIKFLMQLTRDVRESAGGINHGVSEAIGSHACQYFNVMQRMGVTKLDWINCYDTAR